MKYLIIVILAFVMLAFFILGFGIPLPEDGITGDVSASGGEFWIAVIMISVFIYTAFILNDKSQIKSKY